MVLSTYQEIRLLAKFVCQSFLELRYYIAFLFLISRKTVRILDFYLIRAYYDYGNKTNLVYNF